MLRGARGWAPELDALQTRISRAAALTLLALLLGFPAAARALAVTSFAPGDVTTGTRLTIKGDFAELTGARARPKVFGRRSDTSKTVKFEVLAFSRRTIIARVREVPSTKSDPAAGKTWSLVVRSAAGGGETVEADDLFTTSGPALVALSDAEVTRGNTVALYALDPGAKSPTVFVGRKKAKVLRSAPAGESRDDDPWLVQFRLPKLRNGFYPVRLENSLGRAPGAAELLVFGSDAGGLGPYARVSLPGLAGFDSPTCSWSAIDGRLRVEACAGDPCTRSLTLEFEPDLHGGYEPAVVEFSDASPGVAHPQLLSSAAGAKLLPAPSADLLAGAFIAVLRPSDGSQAPDVRVRGYFQALPSDSGDPTAP